MTGVAIPSMFYFMLYFSMRHLSQEAPSFCGWLAKSLKSNKKKKKKKKKKERVRRFF